MIDLAAGETPLVLPEDSPASSRVDPPASEP